jgi:2'-5' RNA ligase
MTKTNPLFFIALLPPEDVRQFVTEIKQHFAQVYNSKAALKSPPHITLQPPFAWKLEDVPLLEAKLAEFAQTQTPVLMILDGFAAFKPRVIYINVLKNAELLTIHEQLTKYLETSFNLVHQPSKNRSFSPHLTVGFRDLTKPNFYQAWSEFEHRQLRFEFRISQLTLLRHNGRCWEIHQNFPLLPSPES